MATGTRRGGPRTSAIGRPAVWRYRRVLSHELRGWGRGTKRNDGKEKERKNRTDARVCAPYLTEHRSQYTIGRRRRSSPSLLALPPLPAFTLGPARHPRTRTARRGAIVSLWPGTHKSVRRGSPRETPTVRATISSRRYAGRRPANRKRSAWRFSASFVRNCYWWPAVSYWRTWAAGNCSRSSPRCCARSSHASWSAAWSVSTLFPKFFCLSGVSPCRASVRVASLLP